MSGSLVIPQSVIDSQTRASDPSISAWVSANAGSGKTHVLAQRVIRLLLRNVDPQKSRYVDPQKILCLTFTKAAAANMANRVFQTLARWIALDDEQLEKAIAALQGRPPKAAELTRARRLFAEALETPGGLKVQTIHAFCTALLHQFPFEANVAAHFEVLEDAAYFELIDRIRLEVFLEAAEKPDTPLGQALKTAIVSAADITFAGVIREAVAERGWYDAWIERAGSIEAAAAGIAATLGLAPGDTLDSVDAEILASPILPMAEWDAVMAALQEGSKTDREHIQRLGLARTGDIFAYQLIFCSTSLEPRQNVVTKAFARACPDFARRLAEEQSRACALFERRRAVVLRDRSVALLTVTKAVLDRYRSEKNRRGLLDYDDLIEKTLALFDNSDAAWVHYKLDLGIDHVLIDEAQDTSPQQWEVVRKLTAEFFAGAGARERVARSIFAVGDEKQSIFSFQGAVPSEFDDMRSHFEALHGQSRLAFERVPLLTSFRSVPAVLGAVDAVFREENAHEGLSADRVAPVHQAVRHTAPGLVEVWALEVGQKKQQVDQWDKPLDAEPEDSPRIRLAGRIARYVREAIARGDRVGDGENRRAVRPGDFLVLVRQRGPLFEAVIRALKEANIEVAGADRLTLTDHIAIMDLMSLGDALLLREDDLALAESLKSPLFGLDDAQLFTLAYERKGSLRSSLREKAGEAPAFAAAHARLEALAADAQRLTPFAFYAQLLGKGGGRRQFLSRLGPEVNDALDEFLALALDYERREIPSLQGFLAWVRRAQAEVKRDMEMGRDEVRVMTVHGAKGLEAPVVILADTTTQPTGPRDPALMRLGDPEAAVGDGLPIVWAAGKKADVPPVAAAREAARKAAAHEHARLLYVALTRAADRLIVCGARGPNKAPEGCWYDLVHGALSVDADEIAPAEDDALRIWRWPRGALHADDAGAPGMPPAAADASLPAWLTEDAAAPVAPYAVLSPSRLMEAQEGARVFRPRDEARRKARERGVLVHKLLALLPDVSPGRRAEAAHIMLARSARKLDAADVAAVTGQVLAILGHPRFAPLFGPLSRAEVPVVGSVRRADGALARVSGQIDRLAVTDTEVFIADYKTDRLVTSSADAIAAPYRAQLALYALLVGRLYPGRTVRAALVFTEAATLVEIPPESLAAALQDQGVSAP